MTIGYNPIIQHVYTLRKSNKLVEINIEKLKVLLWFLKQINK